MENTRRSFLKKMTAAGVGAAGLAMAGTASATTVAGSSEPQKKKTDTTAERNGRERSQDKLQIRRNGSGECVRKATSIIQQNLPRPKLR